MGAQFLPRGEAPDRWFNASMIDMTTILEKHKSDEETSVYARRVTRAVARRGVKALVFLSVIALLLLLAYGFWTDPRVIPSPLVGGLAPDFTLTLLDGKELRLRDLRGQPVVVNFWASWCYPSCWNEAPRLEANWQRHKDHGVMMIGVIYQDTEGNARGFIEKHRKTYPNGVDVNSRIAIEYGVFGIPETFFIDREGMETLTGEVEALLSEPQSGGGSIDR